MSLDVTPPRASSLSERVAEEIRVVLARRRIRQSQLARKLGVSEQWISVRLLGKQPIDLDDLERIAHDASAAPLVWHVAAGDHREHGDRAAVTAARVDGDDAGVHAGRAGQAA